MLDPGGTYFKGIVNSILDSGKSFNIDGRGGTGQCYTSRIKGQEYEI